MRRTGIKLRKQPKILIVEDDINQSKLMARLLRQMFRCEIVHAADGLEALMVILMEKNPPDLVLLDLILPFLNGIEFLKIVRGRPEFDRLPVIVTTSIAETVEIQAIMGDWIHSYLAKPLEKTKLADKVVSALHDITIRTDYS